MGGFWNEETEHAPNESRKELTTQTAEHAMKRWQYVKKASQHLKRRWYNEYLAKESALDGKCPLFFLKSDQRSVLRRFQLKNYMVTVLAFKKIKSILHRKAMATGPSV